MDLIELFKKQMETADQKSQVLISILYLRSKNYLSYSSVM